MTDRIASSVLVDDEFGIESLPQVDVGAVSEDWIQRLVDAQPGLLPVAEVDDRVQGELISLGREIATPVGYIDNLMLSRDAMPVICEAKLWRNPASRRAVIGQILDYATHVRRWTDVEYETAARARWSKSLFEVCGEGGEAAWFDRLRRNLRSGRMTLLIVGDGMREETADLVEALDGHPDFEFRIGLVELRIHQMKDGRRLVTPQVVTKSTEVLRGIVRIEGDPSRFSMEPPPSPRGVSSRRGALTESVYFETMQSALGEDCVRVVRNLLDGVSAPVEVTWASKSLGLKVRDPAASGKQISLVTIPADSSPYVWLPWTEPQLVSSLGDRDAVGRVTNALLSLFDRFGARRTARSSSIDLPALSGREAEFIEGLVAIAKQVEQESAKLGTKNR